MIDKILKNAANFEGQIAHLKEKSDYWPEIYTEVTPNGSRMVKIWVSTLQRYKHEGKWYVRHHVQNVVSADTPTELGRRQSECLTQLIMQMHLSDVCGEFISLDTEDVCQLEEKERIYEKYKWTKPINLNA